MTGSPVYSEFYLCESCQRTTVSTLCGCPNPKPNGPLAFAYAAAKHTPNRIGLEREGWDTPPDAA